MDDYTITHLNMWIERVIAHDEQERVFSAIIDFINDDNADLLLTHSWPEIMRMAEIKY